jgi:allantoinase
MLGRFDYPLRRLGLDHQWFKFRALPTIQKLKWPQGSVAVCICVPVEYFPLDSHAPAVRPLGGLDRGYPDFWSYSNRDYGMRLGIYRIMRVLDALSLKATAQVQANAAKIYPAAINEIMRRHWEVVAAGLDMGRPHHGGLKDQEESNLFSETSSVLRNIVTSPIRGWASPGQIESLHTLDLVSENKFDYVCDWTNDELPYWIQTTTGNLLSMPSIVELSDRYCMTQLTYTMDDYVQQVRTAFDNLKIEYESTGCARMLTISISPWVTGYPHRIQRFAKLIEALLKSDAAWFATLGEVADIYSKTSPYEEVSKDRGA